MAVALLALPAPPAAAQATLSWVSVYDSGGFDYSTHIAVDQFGAPSVGGVTGDPSNYRGWLTLKYNSDGTLRWAMAYPASNVGDEYITGLAVDGAGNTIVTGSTFVAAQDRRITTIKYAPDGTTLWIRHINGPSVSQDEAGAVAVSPAGDIYITGGTNAEFLTLKYDGDGNQLWERRYQPGQPAAGAVIALDLAGNVFIAGKCYSGSAIATAKYTPDGTLQWGRIFDGPASNEYAAGLAVDASGSPVVIGSTGSLASTDWVTLKYDSAGNPLWARYYSGTLGGSDWAERLALDQAGNIYILGRLGDFGPTPEGEHLLLKYSPGGDELWEVRRPFFSNGPGPGGLALDPLGAIYTSVTHGADMITTRYTPEGQEVWSTVYASSRPHALAINGDGALFVTGSSVSPGIADILTLKYQQQALCYPNCDASTQPPILNIADFTCFLQRFAAGESYANCDNSTQPPTLNVADFTCFLQSFAAGCP